MWNNISESHCCWIIRYVVFYTLLMKTGYYHGIILWFRLSLVMIQFLFLFLWVRKMIFLKNQNRCCKFILLRRNRRVLSCVHLISTKENILREKKMCWKEPSCRSCVIQRVLFNLHSRITATDINSLKFN